MQNAVLTADQTTGSAPVGAPHADIPRAWAILIALLLINLPTGTLYAFSVFIPYYEALHHVSRATLATIFSVSTIGFTIGMLMGPVCYRWASPARLVLGFGSLIATGWALAALAPDLVVLAIAYGLLFGLGGGFCYNLLAQMLNLSVSPRRRGMANGVLTASFALGAALFAPLCGLALKHYGLRPTLFGMAGITLTATLLASGLVAGARVSLHSAASLLGGAQSSQPARTFPLMWMGFALGAGVGLLSLSSAAPIVASYGGQLTQSLLGTATVAMAATIGRLVGGGLSDLLPVKAIIVGAHALGAAAMGALLMFPSSGMAIGAMSLACFGYGLLSGSYAASVARYFGPGLFGRMSGRLYTAWGLAGIVGPWVAGSSFDRTGGYQAAIVIGGCAMAAGAVLSLALPPAPAPSRTR